MAKKRAKPRRCEDCGEPCWWGRRCKRCFLEYQRSEEYRRGQSEVGKIAQNRPEVRARKRETALALWQNPEYAARMSEANRITQNRPEAVARNAETTRDLHAAGTYDHLPALLRGEGNSQWRGGPTRYPPEFNRALRRSIRARDGYRCRICGMTQEEHLAKYNENLGVHHEDYDKENNDSANLITLCKRHHNQTTFGNRDYWQAYFTGASHEAIMGAIPIWGGAP